MKKTINIINIDVDYKKISLSLFIDHKRVDQIDWSDENNLSLTLLKSISQLLKRNKIKKRDVKKIKTNFNQAGYSSERIIQINALAGNYSLTNFQK